MLVYGAMRRSLDTRRYSDLLQLSHRSAVSYTILPKRSAREPLPCKVFQFLWRPTPSYLWDQNTPSLNLQGRFPSPSVDFYFRKARLGALRTKLGTH